MNAPPKGIINPYRKESGHHGPKPGNSVRLRKQCGEIIAYASGPAAVGKEECLSRQKNRERLVPCIDNCVIEPVGMDIQKQKKKINGENNRRSGEYPMVGQAFPPKGTFA
jgi:hypothetical protein